jgi:hypothetical protein
MQLIFELDSQIIYHIIYSQAGLIGKAVIEWWGEEGGDSC